MKRLAAALFVLALGIGGATAASDSTAEQKRVYAEVNDNLGGMQKLRAEVELPGAPVAAGVTTWSDDGVVRKISIIYPGDHGDTVEDYYYGGSEDGGELMFVFQRIETRAIDGSHASARENRYYFRDGHLFLWLDDKRHQVSPSSDAFSRAEEDLTAASDAVLDTVVAPEPTSGSTPTVPDDAEELTGTFDGIEQGDYAYLKLEVDGEERSFIILETDAAIDKLIDDPDSYMGEEITVVWQAGEEDLPEAGGKVEVEKLLTVRLPE